MKKRGLNKFRENYRAFLSALSFLTRLPLPGFLHTNIDKETVRDDFRRSIYWFPAAGIILGFLLALFDILLGFFFPPPLASGLLLALYVIMTGGLHLDGLMDSADGLLSGRAAEKIPEIMRDSTSGAFAVIAVLLYIILKFLCFWLIFSGWRAGVFIFMAVLSRVIMSFALIRLPILSNSLAEAFAGNFSAKAVIKLLWIPVLLIILLDYFNFLPLYVIFISTAISLIITLLLVNKVVELLGGMTGDVFGLLNELNELVVLLVIIALQ